MKKLIAILALMTTVSVFAGDVVTLSREEGEKLQIQVKNAIKNATLRCTLTEYKSSNASEVFVSRDSVVIFLSEFIDDYTFTRPAKNQKGYIEFSTKSLHLTKVVNGETIYYRNFRTLKLYLNENLLFITWVLRYNSAFMHD